MRHQAADHASQYIAGTRHREQGAPQSAPQVDQPPTKSDSWTSRASSACVMTPHPLEAARLLGCSVQAIQADRIGSAQRIAARYCCTVVLKGAGTVVAESDGTWSINASGGPLLAVAGTGDVLAGVIGGLMAQGLSAPDAARLGVWLHGAAADALSSRPQWASGIGLPASELAGSIRACINRLAAPDGRYAD
ncbi:MAG: NAD(P)H-hydrate dehydratase [Burkholderiales bacterium]